MTSSPPQSAAPDWTITGAPRGDGTPDRMTNFPIRFVATQPEVLPDDTAFLITQTTGADGQPAISAVKITGLPMPSAEPAPDADDIQFNWKCQGCPARSAVWRAQCPSCGSLEFVDMTR
ncbi:hypothetical protein [Micromonospora haikouensis]|uniref:hypothetical protein n=1 Tax=Micromonospora haikouensis TaxID=686309 RepID=UPI003D724DDF